MSQMHIIAASRSLPFHSIGGMQAIAWDLLREFVRMGHRVTVLTTEIAGRKGEFVHEGVLVVPIQGAAPEKYTSAWWRGSRQYVQAQPQGTYDGVLSISAAAAGLLGLKRELGVPFVFQAHGTSWGEIESKFRSGKPLQWLKSIKNFYWLFKDATIYQRFDHLALVGDVLQKQFSSWPVRWLAHGVPRSVIRNGVNEVVFKPDRNARLAVRERHGWSDEDTVFAFAARLHPQKGAWQTLRAFEALASGRPDLKLLLIGGGEDESALRAHVSQSSLASQIVLTGAVDRTEIPALLACADVFVFPTQRKEGLPMNVLEALSCGLPVVVSDTTQDVFAPDLPLTYCNASKVDDIASKMRMAAIQGHQAASLLTPDYRLGTCAARYLALFGAKG